MRRVVSVWLPTLATDRLRRQGAFPCGKRGYGPLITTAHDGRRMVVAAVDATAAVLGLRSGMPLAQAHALVPGLERVLRPNRRRCRGAGRLAAWCLRYAPLSAAAPPDGIWLDVTGCAHLQGGETKLLRDLVGRLAGPGDRRPSCRRRHPGCGARVARSRPSPSGRGLEVAVVPSAGRKPPSAPACLEALRLPADTLDGLRLLGFERSAHWPPRPRAV